jgi:hypothetical protein
MIHFLIVNSSIFSREKEGMNSAIRRRMIINYCKHMTIKKVTVENYCWRSIEEVCCILSNKKSDG